MLGQHTMKGVQRQAQSMISEEFGCKVSIATPATKPRGGQFVVHITGQVRRVTRRIRPVKRRAAVEPVIGHLKAEHRMGRNHLKGRDGDRANAILAAATTSPSSCAGSGGFCAPSRRRCYRPCTGFRYR